MELKKILKMKLRLTVNIVEEVLEFNKQNQELKILTPEKMLSRLPIS